MITWDELIKQHEELWKDTTLEQQIAKFAEEHEEFMKAQLNSPEELMEIADMFIVSAGIARFSYAEGLEHLYITLDKLRSTTWSTYGLLGAVEEKMAKNRSRNWVKKDDVGYHHE